jgi:hypothetical protein
MHQIFSVLWETYKWIAADPKRVQAAYQLAKFTERTYKSLPPETKAKVDIYIRWGVEKAIKVGIKAAVGDLADLILGSGGDSILVDFAKRAVERGVEIGVDKAIEEARRTEQGEAFLPASSGENSASPRGREEAFRRIEEEISRIREDEDAAHARRAQEEAIRRAREGVELAKQERMASKLAASRAHQSERERPWRILRNTGRLTGVGVLAVATFAISANMLYSGSWCSGVVVFLGLSFFTLSAFNACSDTWEREALDDNRGFKLTFHANQDPMASFWMDGLKWVWLSGGRVQIAAGIQTVWYYRYNHAGQLFLEIKLQGGQSCFFMESHQSVTAADNRERPADHQEIRLTFHKSENPLESITMEGLKWVWHSGPRIRVTAGVETAWYFRYNAAGQLFLENKLQGNQSCFFVESHEHPAGLG